MYIFGRYWATCTFKWSQVYVSANESDYRLQATDWYPTPDLPMVQNQSEYHYLKTNLFLGHKNPHLAPATFWHCCHKLWNVYSSLFKRCWSLVFLPGIWWSFDTVGWILNQWSKENNPSWRFYDVGVQMLPSGLVMRSAVHNVKSLWNTHGLNLTRCLNLPANTLICMLKSE